VPALVGRGKAEALDALVAGEDRCAASFVYTGTHRGVLLGVPPTGKTLRFTSCDILRIAGGRIAEHWGMGDIAGVCSAGRNVVGLMPHPERACDPLLGSDDGRRLLESLLAAAAGPALLSPGRSPA